MTGIRTIIFLLGCVAPRLLIAQEYNYKHYDIGDGLPSSTVYCVTQDRDGFLWMGTAAGVCRFDGTTFKTYTTNDGLPNVEVLQLFGDSRGRVWMAPFGGSVCYYYEGIFHHPGNDPILVRMRLRGNVENFAEDAAGDILVQEATGLQLIRTNGRIEEYDSIGGAPIVSSLGCSKSLDGHFTVEVNQQIFELSDTGFRFLMPVSLFSKNQNYLALSPSWVVSRTDSTHSGIHSMVNGDSTQYPFFYHRWVTPHVSYSIIRDSLVAINQIAGTVVYDPHRGAEVDRYLPGKRVSRTFLDAAGNLWFTTLGAGIYRLTSTRFRLIRLPEGEFGAPSVFSVNLNSRADQMLIGDNQNVIFRLSYPGLKIINDKPTDFYASDRILAVRQVGEKRYWWGSDNSMCIGEIGSLKHLAVGWGIKAACMVDEYRMLVGGPWGAAIVDIRTGRAVDTLWRSRICALYSRNDSNYIGTLNGLWRLAGKNRPQFMGARDSFFRNRIAAVTETPDGVLWVASYDAGLMAYKDGKVIASIDAGRGLVGKICHYIFLQHGVLWVGTDKGLNKIELGKPGYPISFFDADDGLGSDEVNVIYGTGSTIFVGTPAGLCYFDESIASAGDECRLNVVGAISSGINRIADTAALRLPVTNNNIRFEWVGISYRSVGKIRYRYRLLGLDTVWRETMDNYLAFPTLPSGQYELQLQAVNRFGNRSELKAMPFEVETPFWKQAWFYGMALVVFLALTWLFVSWRIGMVRRQQEQKARQSRRMAELEHIALQSQMNPHFIFNCLNSIQQFVFDRDMMATNEYISGFARLIRATLNNSSRAFISVAEEVEYLTDYLSMEKMRFKNKMNYAIEVAPDVHAETSRLPPMLLQPFVENSIRHGLRHKTMGQGFIAIRFWREGERVFVSIRDNGIGRKKAMEYKTGEHIEYQSKGMSLTASRVQMMQTLYKARIEVQVEDVTDSDGQPGGTSIVIEFPVFKDGGVG